MLRWADIIICAGGGIYLSHPTQGLLPPNSGEFFNHSDLVFFKLIL